MPPIGTSVLELAYNKESIGVTFRSILKSTIEASKAALIGNTRQKELVYLQTSSLPFETNYQPGLNPQIRKEEGE